MIWLRLKLDLLPCISQEVDKVSKDYMGLKFVFKGFSYFFVRFSGGSSKRRQNKLSKFDNSSKRSDCEINSLNT